MGGIASNLMAWSLDQCDRQGKKGADLVPQSLRSDNSNFITNTLVCLEIKRELRVVAL